MVEPSFYQNNILVTYILFELCLFMIFSPVANLMHHPLEPHLTYLDALQELALPEDNAAGHGVSESGYCGHLRPALKFDVSTGPPGGPWRIVNDYSATHHRVLAE